MGNQERSKPTPGPWNLEVGRSFATPSGRFHLAYRTDPATGAAGFPDYCELDANARLIALAPDMLAALRALASTSRDHLAAPSPLSLMAWRECMDAARAILAQVEEK